MPKSTHRFDVDLGDATYFRFRRWIRARDPTVKLSTTPVGEDGWRFSVATGKRYLARHSRRRWAQ